MNVVEGVGVIPIVLGVVDFEAAIWWNPAR